MPGPAWYAGTAGPRGRERQREGRGRGEEGGARPTSHSFWVSGEAPGRETTGQAW